MVRYLRFSHTNLFGHTPVLKITTYDIDHSRGGIPRSILGYLCALLIVRDGPESIPPTVNGLYPLSFISQGHRPLLAVCVGMQLLVTGSDEGAGAGLNWIPGHCRKLVSPKDSPIKVPHMGWNALSVLRDDSLLDEFDRKQRFYFVHSYYYSYSNDNYVLGITNYGINYPSVISNADKKVIGVQFHPEKSHKYGFDFFNCYFNYF